MTAFFLIHELQDILVDDEIWEQGVLESVDIDAGTASLKPTSNLRSWTALTEVDFSSNSLPYIDESVVNITCIEFDSRDLEVQSPNCFPRLLPWLVMRILCYIRIMPLSW